MFVGRATKCLYMTQIYKLCHLGYFKQSVFEIVLVKTLRSGYSEEKSDLQTYVP